MSIEKPRGKSQKWKDCDVNTLAQKSAKPSGHAGLAGATCCQVQGCHFDLSEGKDYHRRYRICEEHAFMKRVLVNGTLSRFCQQCGRFEDLDRFDDNKRSCRFSLQRHNLRRRSGNKATTATVAVSNDISPPATLADTTNNNFRDAPAVQRQRPGTRKRYRRVAALLNPGTRNGPFLGSYEERLQADSMNMDGEGQRRIQEPLSSQDLSDCPDMEEENSDSFRLPRSSNPQVENPFNHGSQFQKLLQAVQPNSNLSAPDTWAGRNSRTQNFSTSIAPNQNLIQAAELNADSSTLQTWAVPSQAHWDAAALPSDTPLLFRTLHPPGAYQTIGQDDADRTPADLGLHRRLVPPRGNRHDFPRGFFEMIPSSSSAFPQHTRGDMVSTVHMEAHTLYAASGRGERLSPHVQQQASHITVLRNQLEDLDSMPVRSHNTSNLSIQAPLPPLLSSLAGTQSTAAAAKAAPGSAFAKYPLPTFGASAMLSNPACVHNAGLGRPLPHMATPQISLSAQQRPRPLSASPAAVQPPRWQDLDHTLLQTPLRVAASPAEQDLKQEDGLQEEEEDESEEDVDVMAGAEGWTMRAVSYNQAREKPEDLEMLLRSISDPSAHARANNARRG